MFLPRIGSVNLRRRQLARIATACAPLVLFALALLNATSASASGAAVEPPGVDLTALDDAGRSLFREIAEEQFCPCGKPQSFWDSLQPGGDCAAAPRLAAMLVKELAEGKNKRAAMKALLKAIANLNARYSLDTASSPRLGPADARVEVVIFSDFECPHCRRVAAPLTSIVKKHKEAALVYKCYPIGFHKNARRAAIAALAAGRQGKFWEMHDAIYDSDDAPTDEKLENIARRLKLDIVRWKRDIDDPQLAAIVDADKKEGDKANIQGTPSFFVNGLLVEDLDAVARTIKQELAQ